MATVHPICQIYQWHFDKDPVNYWSANLPRCKLNTMKVAAIARMVKVYSRHLLRLCPLNFWSLTVKTQCLSRQTLGNAPHGWIPEGSSPFLASMSQQKSSILQILRSVGKMHHFPCFHCWTSISPVSPLSKKTVASNAVVWSVKCATRRPTWMSSRSCFASSLRPPLVRQVVAFLKWSSHGQWKWSWIVTIHCNDIIDDQWLINGQSMVTVHDSWWDNWTRHLHWFSCYQTWQWGRSQFFQLWGASQSPLWLITDVLPR